VADILRLVESVKLKCISYLYRRCRHIVQQIQR